MRDAGRSLIKLIWDSVRDDEPWRKNSGIDSEAQIVLSSPEETGEQHKLSIFLYRIEEDVYLRSAGWEEIESNDNPVARFSGPALSLRLFYMITPQAKQDEVNHIIIGRLLQIFNDNPILKAPFLQGSLSGTELKLIFNPLTIDDMNKIWGIISRSRPYVPSLFYEVSRIYIESSRVTQTGKVLDVDISYSQKKKEDVE